MSKTLKALFETELLTAPGVFDGLSAKLTEQAGFSAIYASGGAIARSTGRPDLGLLSLTEVTHRIREITNATTLAVIADADTGFGDALNVIRTVEEFEHAGAAAIHLEDQVFPKRCGHLSGKALIGAADMCIKIRAAIRTRKNPDFLIIARTDAIAVEGFEQALERARQYLEAGADMIFVEAPESLKQIEKIAKAIPQPKLINMFFGGKTPLVPTHDLNAMGYNIAIIPSDLQRAAIKGMQLALNAIRKEGNSASITEHLISFDEREKIIETNQYLQAVDSFIK